uniref:Uncharacterized protein n=1 Tax=Anguilla anguilla TaxID=7936 RepID=A0A0E9WAL7_ANGAN
MSVILCFLFSLMRERRLSGYTLKQIMRCIYLTVY